MGIPAVDAAPVGADPAAATDDAGGAAVPGTAQVSLPKRVALWKLPCPRIGDQATPAFCFIA
jgi:hypothetical protein